MLDEPEEVEGANEVETEAVAPPEERETRGLLWILVPTVLGLGIGTAVGDMTGVPQALGTGLMTYGMIGAGIGAALGTVIWAFFPYKARPKKSRPGTEP